MAANNKDGRLRAGYLKLRGQLLFLICLATLPAVAFIFFVAANERRAALARAEHDALALAGLASREHAHQIRGAREVLQWLGARLAEEGLSSPIVTDRQFLSALLAGHPQLANIGVLAPDGRVLSSAYPLASDRRWDDNPAYRAALQTREVAVGTYLISPIFERPTLNHAFAARDPQGGVLAVLFNGLDLEWISELTRQTEFPPGFTLLIADGSGTVLAQGTQPHPDLGEGPLRIADIATVAAIGRGRMIDVGKGLRQYFVARPLHEAAGLYVAVSLPYARVLREANASFYRTLAGLGVLTLFTIVAVFMAAEIGILRGVRSLARTAHRFGAGDFAARVRVPRGHNEFESLARTFNTMADSLAARHREGLLAQGELRGLAARIHVARETEAARISRELHDQIGQLLTSLKIDLLHLQSSCPAEAASDPCSQTLRQRVAAMNEQIGTAMDFVRRIATELRPGVLDKLGLTAALEWQAREIESRTDLVVQVETDHLDEPLDDLLAVTLFRIAQEALTNIVRHAEAHVVEVGLSKSGHELTLTVRDDGKGIVGNVVESRESLGILGMRERVMLINGALAIEGAPGRGTTVRVTVPLTPSAEHNGCAC